MQSFKLKSKTLLNHAVVLIYENCIKFGIFNTSTWTLVSDAQIFGIENSARLYLPKFDVLWNFTNGDGITTLHYSR